ncbi:MAG: GNAT family N-acetyltransferase [Deltaproteobacteria bacterium]|nr:GNAT family N-acetyltransferase [Deltaproteobacteria bacterium]
MEEADLDALAAVYTEAYSDQHQDDADTVRAYLAKFFGFEPASCYVVEEEGPLVGAVLGYSYRKFGRDVLFLQELFVAPKRRHEGYGRALVAQLRSNFEKAQVKVVPLVKADTRVLNFYNSLGFEKDQAFSFFDD